MKSRTLYLAAYDIRHPRRLRQAHVILRDYALGYQKSVFECPLTANELDEILTRLRQVIDPDEDKFALIRLDARCSSYALGRGVSLSADDLFYIG